MDENDTNLSNIETSSKISNKRKSVPEEFA